ncbi:TonB-dependent receptor plug domain-containing protein [Labilibaculum sp. A4]|uniref:TonB-dependent receptor n=1 Tax=Labilibaculum euxinus TaxID=2686357 RepID=UPI000F620138|nr:TonB-dependent receptor [Labilibaculum euxinus]MDQ1770189.1 TonB-dependent receptor [Labilibaculum euxinus]MWN77597.1 TonB-dependent receptor plug domain-containing protein [Labilibaculum euxinus]
MNKGLTNGKKCWIDMKLSSLIVLFVLGITFIPSQAISQTHPAVKGRLVAKESGKPIAFATVVLKESLKWSTTNLNGEFSIDNVPNGEYTIMVSCLGYQKIQDTISLTAQRKPFTLQMSVESQDLSEVIVIAEESRENGTSSTIKKEALKHLQPSSFADILELLPGGVSQKNSMTTMKLISLREPGSASSFSNDSYDYNSSFGTSFVIDGQAISNDAELQNVTGSYSSDRYIRRRNTTGKGIDMRLISTDNIESVEIVRGIPSVKYGDLTSGLVNITRAYKAKPLTARIKADPGSKLFSIGKGVNLGGSKSLNADIDYLDYKSDPRNPKVNYSRITGSVRYGSRSESENGLFTFNANIDYTGSFDETKKDPEIDLPETDKYKSKYNKVSAGTTLSWQSYKSSIFKGIEARVNGSYTHNQKVIDKSVLGNNTPIMTNREEGEFYSEYLPSSYLSHLVVDGKPIYLFADVSSDFQLDIFNVKQNILIGAEWRYNKNFGDGEVYDVNRPLYPGNGRSRVSKDIPSIQRLSFYMEDKLSIPIANHRLNLQGGVRATQALNMASDYALSGKLYFDPRANMRWRFPKFNLFNRSGYVELTGGYGMHTKFPGLTHLYPDMLYLDIVQLNYFSQNKDLRQVQYKTKMIDPINYQLKPNRNEKFEFGFNLKLGKARAYVTAYHELLKNGFKRLGYYETMGFKLYDVSSGPHPDELSGPPTVEQFDYESRKEFIYYSKRANGAREEKVGVEYQIDLGQIDAIHSRVSINGAWMRAKYDLSDATYKHPSTVIDGKDYPYIGYYNWDRGKEYEQFNTNFRADTHIEKFGLMFSTAIQCMWYHQFRYNPHDGMPEYYFDMDGNQFEYNESHTTDPLLRFLYHKPSPNDFDLYKTPIGIDVNLTVSKSIGDQMELSFYVNRILDYHPDYTRSDGTKVTRKVSPYFGMELNINL